MNIPNLREITDNASAAARQLIQKHPRYVLHLLDKDERPAREAMIRSAIEQWEGQKQATKEQQDQSARIKELEAEVTKLKTDELHFELGWKRKGSEIERLKALVDSENIRLNNNCKAMDETIGELQTKLAAAEKRVAELEKSNSWTSINERMPTREDSDQNGSVIVTNGRYQWLEMAGDSSTWTAPTHWMSFNPPKQPTPEEKSRAEFEEWYAQYDPSHDAYEEQLAWAGWQAARKEKV